MKKFYSFALAALVVPAMAMADATDAAYFDNYAAFQGTSTHGNGDSSRGCNTMTVSTSGGESVTVNGTGLANHEIYKDYTEETKLTVKPGETISVTGTSGNTEWMHNFVYVDYGKDGKFDVDLNSTSVNGDLVAFSGYSLSRHSNGTDTADPTTNSAGNTIENGNYWNDTPDFVIPEDLEPGEYRMRVKNDWNSTHPYGRTNETVIGLQKQGNNIDSNGGFIMDITLVVEGGEVVADPVVTFTIGEGGSAMVFGPNMSFVKSGDSFEKGTRVSFSITANEGKVINHLTTNGVEVEAAAGQRTYAYNLIVEEDVDVQITFRGAEVLEFFPVNFTIGEGGRMAVVDLSDGRTLESGDEVLAGRNVKVSIFANDGWEILKLTINGFEMEDAVAQTSYECNRLVDKETTIAVTFKQRPNSIETVGADEEEAVYYNLQGVCVANPAEGVYIRVAGDKAEKVYLRK